MLDYLLLAIWWTQIEQVLRKRGATNGLGLRDKMKGKCKGTLSN